jgi:hypothetical protein
MFSLRRVAQRCSSSATRNLPRVPASLSTIMKQTQSYTTVSATATITSKVMLSHMKSMSSTCMRSVSCVPQAQRQCLSFDTKSSSYTRSQSRSQSQSHSYSTDTDAGHNQQSNDGYVREMPAHRAAAQRRHVRFTNRLRFESDPGTSPLCSLSSLLFSSLLFSPCHI